MTQRDTPRQDTAPKTAGDTDEETRAAGPTANGTRTASGIAGPSAQETRAALAALLSIPALARAPKSSRLLTHLVETHLRGAADELTETAIARAVFEQDATFNPRSNPIVRVNASRLRSLLRTHYDGEGARETVQIRLARVGYAPEITYAPGSAERPTAGTDANGNGAPEPDTEPMARDTAAPGRQAEGDEGSPDTPTAPGARPLADPDGGIPAASLTALLRARLAAPASLGAVLALTLAAVVVSIAYTELAFHTHPGCTTASGEVTFAPLAFGPRT